LMNLISLSEIHFNKSKPVITAHNFGEYRLPIILFPISNYFRFMIKLII